MQRMLCRNFINICREKQAEKEEKQKTKKIETSAEKLRKLLKEEKR